MFPIFMWVKEYNGLKDFKINLDSNYSIKFKTNMDDIKGEEELKILNLEIKKLEPKIPNNFYGDNIDSINLILGKNGTGKSSILDVLSIVDIRKKQIEHMIIYKTKDEKKYILEGYYLMNENYFSFLKNKPKYPIKHDYGLLIDSKNLFLESTSFLQKIYEFENISLAQSLIGKFKSSSKTRSMQEKEKINSDPGEYKKIRVTKLNLNFEEDYYSNLYSYIFSLRKENNENYKDVEMYVKVTDSFNCTNIPIKEVLEKTGEKKEKLVLYELNGGVSCQADHLSNSHFVKHTTTYFQ